MGILEQNAVWSSKGAEVRFEVPWRPGTGFLFYMVFCAMATAVILHPVWVVPVVLVAVAVDAAVRLGVVPESVLLRWDHRSVTLYRQTGVEERWNLFEVEGCPVDLRLLDQVDREWLNSELDRCIEVAQLRSDTAESAQERGALGRLTQKV